jgi:hypothetical protein
MFQLIEKQCLLQVPTTGLVVSEEDRPCEATRGRVDAPEGICAEPKQRAGFGNSATSLLFKMPLDDLFSRLRQSNFSNMHIHAMTPCFALILFLFLAAQGILQAQAIPVVYPSLAHSACNC